MACEYRVQRPDDPFLDAAFRGNVRDLEVMVGQGKNGVERNSVNCKRYGNCPEDLPLDVTVTDLETGKNALHYAAYQDNRRALKYLISLGVPLNHLDNEGRTPLYEAVIHKDSLQILLDAGAKIGFKGKGCGSLLDFAIQRHAHPDRFEQLVGAGAKAEKELILNFANEANNWETQDFRPLLYQLKKAGANPSQVHPREVLRTKMEKREYARLSKAEKRLLWEGKNALHMAILNNSPQAIPPLLEIGVPPFQRDHNGDTPLSLAKAIKLEMQNELKTTQDKENKEFLRGAISRLNEAIHLLQNN